ncbi:hypothetical protein K6Y82_51060, partial [Burkholderia cenocepacia]
MADEHAPGPSPAYDPWRGQQSDQPQPARPAQGRPGPRAPQPAPPVRNADGSWTVEVHPNDGGTYPQPRRPLGTSSQPTLVQPPQPWLP